MTTEHDFHAALDLNPDDWQTRLVFADWLQEHDDPRARRAARAAPGRTACNRAAMIQVRPAEHDPHDEPGHVRPLARRDGSTLSIHSSAAYGPPQAAAHRDEFIRLKNS